VKNKNRMPCLNILDYFFKQITKTQEFFELFHQIWTLVLVWWFFFNYLNKFQKSIVIQW
jgi:hypothetical protein